MISIATKLPPLHIYKHVLTLKILKILDIRVIMKNYTIGWYQKAVRIPKKLKELNFELGNKIYIEVYYYR